MPVAILTIAALISLMVALVGDVLIARSRSVAVYDLQNALDRIETDARISALFLQTYTVAPNPQGRDGGTGSFNAASPNYDLIFSQNATTQNPYSGTRDLVFYADQPNPCSEDYQSNRPLTVRVIYFTKTETDGSKTLWRRVIVPTWTTTLGEAGSVCASPWQRDTCPVGSTLSTTGPCQSIDEKILTNVATITPTYYDETGASTTDVRNAMSISVAINLSTAIAGETLISNGSARSTRVNATSDEEPTDQPVITLYNQTVNTDNNPLLTSFTWDPIPFANFYSIRYRINGGAWVYPNNQTSNIFKVTTARPRDIINIEVTAKNDLGESPVGTLTHTKPLWTIANLQNGWECYGSTYACPSYTITTAGVVLLHGLAKSGGTNTVVFTLPPELRTNKRIIYAAMGGGDPSFARVDVEATGYVRWTSGTNSYVSFDSIRFLSQSDAVPVWIQATYGGTWVGYGSSYGEAQYVKDSRGRTHVYGLIRYGANVDTGTTLLTLPSDYRPPALAIWTTVSSANVTANYQTSSTSSLTARGQGSTSWFSIAAMYHPTGAPSSFSSLSLGSSWVNYGGSYQTAQYTKASDGLVSLRGLIKAGSTASGSTIATLPAGYCPDGRTIFATEGIQPTVSNATQTTARIDILWDGAANNCRLALITTLPAVGNAWLSLDGIHYFQER